MKKKVWITFFLVGSVILGVAGCGSNTSANTTQGSTSSSQGAEQGQNGRNFQPNIVMKTLPSTPMAGKTFTIQFSMQRPNRSGSSYGPQNGGRHWSESNSQPGNWTGGQNGRTPMQPTMSALVTGNSVNQTITLSRQNGVIEGELTIQQPGTYQVTSTMDLGQRTIQHQFTLQVAK